MVGRFAWLDAESVDAPAEALRTGRGGEWTVSRSGCAGRGSTYDVSDVGLAPSCEEVLQKHGAAGSASVQRARGVPVSGPNDNESVRAPAEEAAIPKRQKGPLPCLRAQAHASIRTDRTRPGGRTAPDAGHALHPREIRSDGKMGGACVGCEVCQRSHTWTFPKYLKEREHESKTKGRRGNKDEERERDVLCGPWRLGCRRIRLCGSRAKQGEYK